ncbi:MAG: hypothetical protein WAU58_07650 [Terriglobales bacterium]
MKILLLHPEDDFQCFRVRDRWDLVVDLGKAPKSSYDDWSHKLGCPVFSIFDLAVEVDDLLAWRELLRLGMGRVVDRFGIDWWDVIGLLLQPEMQDLRLVQRLANKIGTCEALTVTRPSPLAEALRLQLQCPLRVLGTGLRRRVARSVGRIGRAAANLNFRQLRQVVYDKYDARYFLRRNFAAASARSPDPVVLIPSAYSNVTRTAFRYAEVLPDQQFLLVLARETGETSPIPRNVRTEMLAVFAKRGCDQDELRQLESGWNELQSSLRSQPEFSVSAQLGVLSNAKRWLRWGVAVRDAWNTVFERRGVVACLSADDSNPYTRIPLLLARQRRLPAVACHHGALDGIMAFKNPAFSSYLVKGEMEKDYLERVCKVDASSLCIGAPFTPMQDRELWSDGAPWIVFFTEPYETDLWRPEAIYKEIVPRLCVAARLAGKRLVLKLHPFESARQRQRMLSRVLSKDEQREVSIVVAPLSNEILRNTWCAVTVESTTAFECATVGIPAFLCGWLRHAYVGYAPQYARFGVAQMLKYPDDLLNIPSRLRGAIPPANLRDRLVRAVMPEQLSEILSSSQPGTLR